MRPQGTILSAEDPLNQPKEMTMCLFSGNSQPQQSVPTRRTYKCPNCAREYSHRQNLWRHKKYECGKKPQFQCPYCSRKTKFKAYLKQHIALVHHISNYE